MSSHPWFSTPAQRSQGLMGTSSVQRQAGPTENNSFLGPPTGSFPGAGYGVPGPVMMTPLTGYPGLHPFHPIAPSHFISAPNVGTPVPVPQGQLLPQGQQGRTPQAQYPVPGYYPMRPAWLPANLASQQSQHGGFNNGPSPYNGPGPRSHIAEECHDIGSRLGGPHDSQPVRSGRSVSPSPSSTNLVWAESATNPLDIRKTHSETRKLETLRKKQNEWKHPKTNRRNSKKSERSSPEKSPISNHKDSSTSPPARRAKRISKKKSTTGSAYQGQATAEQLVAQAQPPSQSTANGLSAAGPAVDAVQDYQTAPSPYPAQGPLYSSPDTQSAGEVQLSSQYTANGHSDAVTAPDVVQNHLPASSDYPLEGVQGINPVTPDATEASYDDWCAALAERYGYGTPAYCVAFLAPLQQP